MQRLKRVLLLSVATGFLGVSANAMLGDLLEDGIGLRWLYLMRGAIDAPPEVIIVSMDESSRAVLDLPGRTRDWPRSLHARLIDRLVDLGASAIAIDIDFRRDTDLAEDEALSAAIVTAGNVVLVERVDRINAPGFRGSRTQQPIPMLGNSARALAPALIPDVPLVTQGLSFVEDPSRGETPTLPAATLQVHALGPLGAFRPSFLNTEAPVLSLIPDGAVPPLWPDFREAMRALRSELKGNAAAATRELEMLGSASPTDARDDDIRTLQALIRMYRDPGVFYLNFYGPPGAIHTIPFHAALNQAMTTRADIAGKAVFVGAGPSVVSSEDQEDTHHTPLAGENGELSGVEIQATAFANLLANEMLRPVGFYLELGLLWGFGAGVVGVGYLLPRRNGAVVALLAGGVYAAAAYAAFSYGNVLIPLAVPLLIVLPLAFIAARLTRSPSLRWVSDGVCLLTDVAGSTGVSGPLPAERLHELLELYRHEVRTAVGKWSGSVEVPQVGDSVVCFWADPPAWWARRLAPASWRTTKTDRLVDPRRRYQACMAALEIAKAVERFNADHSDEQLPTRMGLHVGRLSIEQDVNGERCGVAGHTVHVTQRLEQLNKTFFKRTETTSPMILTSAEVIDGVDGLRTRYLGVHELMDVGPRAIYQVVGAKEGLDATDDDLCERFAAALQLYEAELWPAAHRAFRDILEVYPTDGPSHYFAKKTATQRPVASSSALNEDDTR